MPRKAEQETASIPTNLRALAAPAQSSLNAVAPTAMSLRSSDSAKRARERSEQLEQSTVKRTKESGKKADHWGSASRDGSVASKTRNKENNEKTAPSPKENKLLKSRVPGLNVCPFCKVKLPQKDCEAIKYTNHIRKIHPNLTGTFLACSCTEKMRFRLGETAMAHMNLGCGGHLVAKHNPSTAQSSRGRQPQAYTSFASVAIK